MDREELELFRASLRQACSSHTGKALDDALDELGWRDALAADRRAAVSRLSRLARVVPMRSASFLPVQWCWNSQPVRPGS